MRHTFFKIILFLLPGIISGGCLPVNWSVSFHLFWILMVLCALLLVRRIRRLFLLLLLVGVGYIHASVVIKNDNTLRNGRAFKIALIEKRNFGQFIADIEASLEDRRWIRDRGTILVNLDGYGVSPGERLVIKGEPYRISDISGVNTWTEYLRKRHVVFGIVVKEAEVLEEKMDLIYRIRDAFSSRIDSLVRSPENKALLKGVLLGSKSTLSEEILDNFQSSGGMHVLAVSGLHVSIIYLFFKLLLSILPASWYFRVLKMVVLIMALWLYAGIAGNTASVTRAVTFFSLFGISELSGRKVILSHVLPFSATILWLWDPMQVFSIGFQLSFGAVLGIMIFQPSFERMISGAGVVAAYLLRSVTLSLSAQSLTWPLIFFYFDGFPLSGIVYSIFLIPAVFILIFSALTALMLQGIPLVEKFLNATVEFVATQILDYMAFAADHSIYIENLTLTELISTSVLLIVIPILVWKTSKRLIFILLTLLLLSCGINMFYPVVNAGRNKEAGFWNSGLRKVLPRVSDSVYDMELFKFDSYCIFITKTKIPLAMQADAIILNGDVHPQIPAGKPQLVFTSRMSYRSRQEWRKLCKQQGLDCRQIGTNYFTENKW